MRAWTLPLALCAGLVLCGNAFADSGAITNVVAGSAGQVSATYTSTSTSCTSTGFCGWYPKAVQSPASQACTPYVDGDGRLTYVGNYQGESGTQTGTDIFYPKSNPVRLCLYIDAPDDSDRLVAEVVYLAQGTTAPTPTAPAPSPSPANDAVEPLTIREAVSFIPGVLREKFGARYTHRRGRLQRSCYRLTSQKVRCRVGWNYSRYRYSGAVTMRNDPDDPQQFIYVTSIRRKRVKSQPPAAPPRAQPKSPSSGCNPNYSGVCLPLSGDVDCTEISARDFRVVGSDPFRLDADNDGIACES